MSLLTVIAVHGIWETPLPTDPKAKLAYTADFEQHVVAELRKQGVIPRDATPDQVAAIVRFDQAQYADIGEAQERLAYDRYRQAADDLERDHPGDRLLDWVLIDRLRRFMIAGASDVLFYMSDTYREQIRDRVRARISAAIEAGDGAVTLVGHSLGSVVAYDVAYYDTYHNEEWRGHGFTLANLVTLGSPLLLFSMAFDDSGQPKPKYTDPAAVKQLVRPGGRWVNCFDAQDLIGYPLATAFPDLVQDVLVQTGTLPTTAHTEYWHNDEVARRVADCLAADYRRLTGGSEK